MAMTDDDMLEASTPLPCSRDGPKLSVTPSSSFDLDSYISNYSGRTKILRLSFIAERVQELEIEALQSAINLAKQSKNVGLYQELVNRAGDHLAAEFSLDAKWIEATTRSNQKELETTEQEFSQTKTKSIREYMRMAHNDFGQHHYNSGNLQESLRCYVRTREYCSTAKHIVEMCLNVIKVAIELGSFQHVANYVSKAEQTPDPLDSVTQAKLMVSSGLAYLDGSKNKIAAKRFVEAPIELGSTFNDVISSQDVAVYGTLCALATFDRSELKSKVIESPSFKQYLELVPEVREMALSFYGSNYGACFNIMEKIKGDLLLDLHLSRHVDQIFERIRNRALVQYCGPYSSVRMMTMAAAFNTGVGELEEELVRLIMEGEIRARIDSHKKILYAKEEDKRAGTFKSVAALGDEYLRTSRSLIVRTELVRNDFCVTES